MPADDEKIRWAIDVMTAWTDDDDNTDFMTERIAAYLSEPDGLAGLLNGFVNLAGLLLLRIEKDTKTPLRQTLHDVAAMLSRHEPPPAGE